VSWHKQYLEIQRHVEGLQ